MLASLVGKCKVFLTPHPSYKAEKEKNMAEWKDQLGEKDLESRRKRALAKFRKRATAEKNLDRAMEDEGKKLPIREVSQPYKIDKDELLKRIGKFALDNWKKDTGTEELPPKLGNRFRKRIDYRTGAEGTTADNKSNIKKGSPLADRKRNPKAPSDSQLGGRKSGGSIKKKSGGPVKSKYTTSNKRYSNSGKTYPR